MIYLDVTKATIDELADFIEMAEPDFAGFSSEPTWNEDQLKNLEQVKDYYFTFRGTSKEDGHPTKDAKVFNAAILAEWAKINGYTLVIDAETVNAESPDCWVGFTICLRWGENAYSPYSPK
ncbi:MAG: hypothetical protein LIP03_10030 [Bacteroidales bacterium]|nr:hypothetical protein [Bacteroidales bacterium]